MVKEKETAVADVELRWEIKEMHANTHTTLNSFLGSFVDRFRVPILTSPLWMSALFIVLNRYASESIQSTIQWLVGSPLK